MQSESLANRNAGLESITSSVWRVCQVVLAYDDDVRRFLLLVHMLVARSNL